MRGRKRGASVLLGLGLVGMVAAALLGSFEEHRDHLAVETRGWPAGFPMAGALPPDMESTSQAYMCPEPGWDIGCRYFFDLPRPSVAVGLRSDRPVTIAAMDALDFFLVSRGQHPQAPRVLLANATSGTAYWEIPDSLLAYPERVQGLNASLEAEWGWAQARFSTPAVIVVWSEGAWPGELRVDVLAFDAGAAALADVGKATMVASTGVVALGLALAVLAAPSRTEPPAGVVPSLRAVVERLEHWLRFNQRLPLLVSLAILAPAALLLSRWFVAPVPNPGASALPPPVPGGWILPAAAVAAMFAAWAMLLRGTWLEIRAWRNHLAELRSKEQEFLERL